MRKKPIIILFIITFILEAIISLFLFNEVSSVKQDTVKVNECLKTIEENYPNKDNYYKELDYSIVDLEGNLIYKTNNSKSKSVNDAIKNNDIILDVKIDNKVIGKLLIKNNTEELISNYKRDIFTCIILISILQLLFIIIYFIYINKKVLKPFKDLDSFAVRVAGGNLDIPLPMDREHVFGSFTESFDLMRSELKKARIAEKEAMDAKKEIVAKLSHDIKTPIASIKSTSEIGYEKTKDKVAKNHFNQINIKTDQIKLLVDNLFNSSINEITEIDVNPSKYNSEILYDLIKNSDYLERLNTYKIPECNIYIDKVRMQQTIDNIITNSYKYANTKIDIDVKKDKEYLIISFRDYGEGVHEQDLPLLKDKYKRGRNVKDKDGAGLGLHLANYFMDNMNGKLELSNSDPGFTVTIYIRII